MQQRNRGSRTSFGAGWARAVGLGARGGAVLGAALSLSSLAATPAWALSDKDEAALGRQMALAVEESMGGTLPQSDPTARRVERIGKRFARLARQRAFPYRYRVLRDNRVLNAFATPGGTIYITSRLVKFARSEDELASILGHETAHVSQRHIAQEVDERNAFVLFGARLRREMRRRVAEENAARNKGKRPSAKAAKPSRPARSAPEESEVSMAMGGSPWASLSWYLLSRGRSREMEGEADALSVRWMKRLGYNPRAAITLLQNADRTLPRSSSPLSSLLASHPGVSERVSALRALIEREKLDVSARATSITSQAARKTKPAATPAAPPKAAAADKAPTTAAADVAAAAASGSAPSQGAGAAPQVP